MALNVSIINVLLFMFLLSEFFFNVVVSVERMLSFGFRSRLCFKSYDKVRRIEDNKEREALINDWGAYTDSF